MKEKNNYSSAIRLKKLRQSLNMTQEQMAEAIGVSDSLYKGNEAGRIPISKKTARLIEEYFGVNVDYIYHGTFREAKDVWMEIMECEEKEKLRILLRLIEYFSFQGKLEFTDEIIDSIKEAINLK